MTHEEPQSIVTLRSLRTALAAVLVAISDEPDNRRKNQVCLEACEALRISREVLDNYDHDHGQT